MHCGCVGNCSGVVAIHEGGRPPGHPFLRYNGSMQGDGTCMGAWRYVGDLLI